LVEFLKQHGVPVSGLAEQTAVKVLIVARDRALVENLKRSLTPEESFRVAVAASGFETGIQAESLRPDCVMVDFSMGRVESLQIC
jgi:PleD family two-component response regulator